MNDFDNEILRRNSGQKMKVMNVYPKLYQNDSHRRESGFSSTFCLTQVPAYITSLQQQVMSSSEPITAPKEKQPTTILCIGMAGSGKTTLMQVRCIPQVFFLVMLVSVMLNKPAQLCIVP